MTTNSTELAIYTLHTACCLLHNVSGQAPSVLLKLGVFVARTAPHSHKHIAQGVSSTQYTRTVCGRHSRFNVLNIECQYHLGETCNT